MWLCKKQLKPVWRALLCGSRTNKAHGVLLWGSVHVSKDTMEQSTMRRHSEGSKRRGSSPLRRWKLKLWKDKSQIFMLDEKSYFEKKINLALTKKSIICMM